MEPNPALVIFGLIFAGIAVYALLKALHAWSRRSMILALPTSQIGSAAEGLVELKGRVRAIKPVQAPYADVPCAYYSFKLQVYRSSGRSGHWSTIHEGHSDQRVLVDDGTGTAIVWLGDAELEIQNKDRASMGTWHQPDDRLRALLTRLGESETDWLGFNRPLRVEEFHFAGGDLLYVLGDATRSPRGGAQNERIIVSKGPDGVLLVSDEDEGSLVSELLWRGVAYFGLFLLLSGVMATFAIASLKLGVR